MPPPGRRFANGSGQLLGIVHQIGHQLGRGVEADHHGLVLPRTQDAIDELHRSFLLELEAVANAVAGVDQDRDAQRQIGLGRELLNHLRLLVFGDGKIVFSEIGDEAAFFVGNREQNVNTRHIYCDPSVGRVDRRGLFRYRLLSGSQRPDKNPH